MENDKSSMDRETLTALLGLITSRLAEDGADGGRADYWRGAAWAVAAILEFEERPARDHDIGAEERDYAINRRIVRAAR